MQEFYSSSDDSRSYHTAHGASCPSCWWGAGVLGDDDWHDWLTSPQAVEHCDEGQADLRDQDD